MLHTQRSTFETYYLTQHSTCIELGSKQTEKILKGASDILKKNAQDKGISDYGISDILALAAIISAQTAQLNISWEKNAGQISMKTTALNSEDKDK